MPYQFPAAAGVILAACVLYSDLPLAKSYLWATFQNQVRRHKAKYVFSAMTLLFIAIILQ